MAGKRVQFEDEDWVALDQLARERHMTFQQLAEEAFHDLFEKHDRPTHLREALVESARPQKRKRSAKKRQTRH